MYTADGTPFNGVKDITFRLYKVAAGGDAAFWTETQLKGVHSNGRFAAVLGNRQQPLEPSDFSGDVWLGIQVVGEAAEMTPRIKSDQRCFCFQIRQWRARRRHHHVERQRIRSPYLTGGLCATVPRHA